MVVGDLIFISFPNYLPHDFKYLNNDNIGNDSYVLNPMIFRFIQKDVNKRIICIIIKDIKIYCFRSNKFISGVQCNLRNIINQGEIISFLRKRGFTIINTEEILFEDQVSAMRGARIVILPVRIALKICYFQIRIQFLLV